MDYIIGGSVIGFGAAHGIAATLLLVSGLPVNGRSKDALDPAPSIDVTPVATVSPDGGGTVGMRFVF